MVLKVLNTIFSPTRISEREKARKRERERDTYRKSDT